MNTVACDCTTADKHAGRRCTHCRIRHAVAAETRRCARIAREVAVEYIRKKAMGLAAVADEVNRRITETAGMESELASAVATPSAV